MIAAPNTVEAGQPVPAADSSFRSSSPSAFGKSLLCTTAALVTLVALPIILRGAPVVDDYVSCVEVAKRGLVGQVTRMFDATGIVRPARYLEVVLIGAVCPQRHLGVLIAVPFIMTLAIAALVRSLLRDLRVPSPWPEVGGALWLLQPLGSEASLWPSALHIPFGLALALIALRLYRRDNSAAAAAANIAACLCVEQVIFALPAAALLVAPRQRRARTLVFATAAAALVLVAYREWPGSDPRAPLTVTAMVRNVFRTPFFYARFPATALGLHSIPLATAWAFPLSVFVLGAGIAGGFALGPRLLAPHAGNGARDDGAMRHLLLAGATLILLLNIPVIVTFPRAASGRVFTPTWLLLAVVGALSGTRLRWRRARLGGAVAGLFAAGALLSLAFSAWVRIRTADIAESSFRWLGARVPQNGVIAICDVRRTMVPYAPTGDFYTSEFLDVWAAEAALWYHSGVEARVRQGGQYGEGHCPDTLGADLVVTPTQILDGVRRDAARARGHR